MFENVLHGIIDKPGPVSESKSMKGRKTPNILGGYQLQAWE